MLGHFTNKMGPRIKKNEMHVVLGFVYLKLFLKHLSKYIFGGEQGRNRDIHMGEIPFLCTTETAETAVAVRLSQHHGHWKALEIVFSLIHSRFF